MSMGKIHIQCNLATKALVLYNRYMYTSAILFEYRILRWKRTKLFIIIFITIFIIIAKLSLTRRSLRIRLVHLDVEDSSEELLAPALLCHKEPARRIQSPLLFCLLLAGSLWHKDSWFPCTERSYYRRPLDATSWFFMA